MQRQIMTRSYVVALATLLTLALPASTVETGEIDTDSPLVDLLLSNGMTREEMVGLYGALAAGQFEPRACVPGQEMFTDVPAASPFCPWIEELARRGITSGCTATQYCPGSPVSRGQMAVVGTPDHPGPCNTDTGSVEPTGSRLGCVSDWGAFDMVGNVGEWVGDWLPRATCSGSCRAATAATARASAGRRPRVSPAP